MLRSTCHERSGQRVPAGGVRLVAGANRTSAFLGGVRGARRAQAPRTRPSTTTDPAKVVNALATLQAQRKEYDRAWLAAQVAQGLIGQVGEAEREILAKLAPYAKKREQATQPLTDRLWKTHLFHPKVRTPLAELMAILFEQVAFYQFDHRLQAFHRAALATLACYGVLVLVSLATQDQRDPDRELFTWSRFRHQRADTAGGHERWWQNDKLWACVLVICTLWMCWFFA